MRTLKRWYVTFKPKGRWTRFGDRYYTFQATSLDQAMKKTIDIFGRDWQNLYTEEEMYNPAVLKDFDISNLTEVSYNEIRREVERQSRIPFKTYREKEVRGSR